MKQKKQSGLKKNIVRKQGRGEPQRDPDFGVHSEGEPSTCTTPLPGRAARERDGAPSLSEPTGTRTGAQRYGKRAKPLMILPQVHLRKPCYDFYFL